MLPVSDQGGCVIPECNEKVHGDELLATIDGNDSRLICMQFEGEFLWRTGASRGGFLGVDLQVLAAPALLPCRPPYDDF